MASPLSSDEGEIQDTGTEKATTIMSHSKNKSIDRLDRTRDRYTTLKSPTRENGSGDRRSRDRSLSPRSPRGYKRSRDDGYYDRNRYDDRRQKSYYDDRRAKSLRDERADIVRRPRVSYHDLDTAGPYTDRYDDRDRNRDRDRYSDKRARTRSRSPYRDNSRRIERRDSRDDVERRDDRSERDSRRYGETYSRSSQQIKDDSPFKRDEDRLSYAREDAKSVKQPSDSNENGVHNIEADPEPTVEEPVDEAALIEQRRKRREAIKAKYRGSATPLLVQALQLSSNSGTPGTCQQESETTSTQSTSPIASSINTPSAASPTATPIHDEQDLLKETAATTPLSDEPSAADYDPTMDMKEDRRRDDQRQHEETIEIQDEPVEEQPVSNLVKPEGDFDMFAEDDEDDMFAEEAPTKPKVADARTQSTTIVRAKELDAGMLDNWDDHEGYYKVILGELLNGRYHVQANLGRGMFSGVVRATDTTSNQLVAIKLIRNNETMRKAGLQEIEILQKLKEADPDDKKHMIRLERHFEHKGHLCMVFEHLSINLREVLKKFGRDVGINLKAVRAYAQQMFMGLSLMRKCNILHADLKPDNMLVNEARNLLKICDLGSASDASENDITPYLVSRFYRAPEIILGMPYDFAIDMWSVGCTLYELYTGKILFTGRSNNQMLRSIMECRGRFTSKMLRRAQFAPIHFDDMANFRSMEQDKITGKDVVKILTFAKPTRDLRSRLLSASKGLTEAETKELNLFIDLLDRCLALNPEKRCTPAEALKHPFIARGLSK